MASAGIWILPRRVPRTFHAFFAAGAIGDEVFALNFSAARYPDVSERAYKMKRLCEVMAYLMRSLPRSVNCNSTGGHTPSPCGV